MPVMRGDESCGERKEGGSRRMTGDVRDSRIVCICCLPDDRSLLLWKDFASLRKTLPFDVLLSAISALFLRTSGLKFSQDTLILEGNEMRWQENF